MNLKIIIPPNPKVEANSHYVRLQQTSQSTKTFIRLLFSFLLLPLEDRFFKKCE